MTEIGPKNVYYVKANTEYGTEWYEIEADNSLEAKDFVSEFHEVYSVISCTKNIRTMYEDLKEMYV